MFKNLIFTTIRTACIFVFLIGSAQAGLNLADGYASGQWWNPARDGEGFYVEVIDTGGNLQIAVAMYSYDEAGNQLWLVGNIAIAEGDQGATVPVFLIEGPVWGTSYDPADKSTTEFGTIVVQFPTCDSALFNVNSTVGGLESGDYSLVRATDLVGVDCVEPPPLGEPPPGAIDITPGLWVAPSFCFFVNTEGTKIVESDLCDNGKSFSGVGFGVEVDIDGNPRAEDCEVNVACVDDWDIVSKTDPSGYEYKEAICLNNAGGIGVVIFFNSINAAGTVYESTDLDGRFCYVADVAIYPSQ